MNKCTICGEKINKKNAGFIDITGKKEQNICIECKKDLLYASIIDPFYR